jgi:hypothetical protein
VTDGDSVVRKAQRVRLVQIDTPEVFFGRECYGRGGLATNEDAASPRHTGARALKLELKRHSVSFPSNPLGPNGTVSVTRTSPGRAAGIAAAIW